MIKRDKLRQYMGERFRATQSSQKKLASAVGMSRQGVGRITAGRARAISYEDLYALALDPKANPDAVVAGAAAVIHEARAIGTTAEIAERLTYWLGREQEADGREDCHQQRVAGVLSALAFMLDNLTIPFRRQAVAELDGWIEHEMRAVDAALAAVGHARALRAKLAPTEAV